MGIDPLLALQCLACALGGYGVGSIPFGVLVAVRHGIDVRRRGSGNIGASNVGRLLGIRYGVLVFALDLGKGAAGGLLAGALFGTPAPLAATICGGLGATLGHCYPVWLGFQGGKGVATSAGALMVLAPLAVAVAVLTWAIAAVWLRIASLASLSALVAFLTVAPLIDLQWQRPQLGLRWAGYALLGALVLLRHRQNVDRLARGRELTLDEMEPEERTP